MKPISQVAIGIVRYNEHVLLIKRRAKEVGVNGEVLDWVFPGGKIEFDETVQKATEREVYEETGVVVKASSTIDARKHPSFPAYIYYVECRMVEDNNNGTITDAAVSAIEWVPLKNFGQYMSRPVSEKVRIYLNIP